MNMRRFCLSQFIAVSAVVCTAASLGGVAYAQGRAAQPFQLKKITKEMKNAPSYGAGAGDLGGGRPGTIARQWLMLETHFTSEPAWSDDVKIKYYVLMGKGKDAKMFTGEVTHVNVQKGNQHYSVMFMHPNTVKRYGAGQVEAVAAVLYYENRPISTVSDPLTNKRWWDDYSPNPGYLLNPLETPWSVIAPERFEALKSSGTP